MSGQPSAVIAVDATSGRELWRVAVARQKLGWPAGPFAGGGIVVVQVDDPAGPAIVGLNATTGETLWRVTEVELGATAPAHAPGPSAVAPLANTDDVVVLSVPTGLVGLDRASGRQIWSSDVLLLDESGVMAARGPAAVDGQTVMIPAASQFVSAYDSSGATVLVPTGGSALVAVDASTGAKLWQGPRLDHPTAAEGYVVGYVRSQGVPSAGPQARVIAVDVATGEQVWSKPGSESYGDLWAIGDGAVYVNDQSSNGPPDVVAYELQTGDERWRRSTSDSSVTHDPQRVADDAVVVLWEFLAVLSTTDGTTRWTVSGSQETPMSSVGHDAASIFVSFNSLPWMD